ncbi:MAG: hypothetical protein IMF09_06970 [Proteobacteria bacterium]|nr:hypothetical protein [Pseudomonadota bacterium]
MKLINGVVTTVIALVSILSFSQVQAEEQYHPFLSDTFNFDVGTFWPDINFDLQVDGSSPGEEIDFDEALNLEDYQAAGSLNFRWRFGEKWSLWAQAYDTSTNGKAVLTKDIEWEDIIFKSGSFVEGGLGTTVIRVFFGRELSVGPQHEFGIGAGLHWMELDTFLKGGVFFDDGSQGFRRVSADAGFPLPNIGAWYMYSWSPKWIFQSRVDWLSASIGDYSGGLWDIQAGVNYQAFKNIGFGIYYKAFLLDVDVDKSSWRGSADLIQSGPVLTLTATW